MEALSPELVLVAPPEVAAAARALLPDGPLVAPRPVPVHSAPIRRTELAALYAACVAATATPVLLLALAR